MRVLIIEDNERITRFVRQGLEEENCEVTVRSDGEQGLQALLDDPPDTCVLDVMMPKLDGFEVLKRARAAGCDVPILLLTARTEVGDRVHGLEVGADDYLTKPFAFDELLARLRVMHRRSQRSPAMAPIEFADIRVDLRTRKAQRGDNQLHLSPREFSLLQLFVENQGRELTRAEILEQVFDLDFDPSTNIVDVYVGYLRKKLGEPAVIKTVRGVGYRLEEAK